MKVQRIVRLAAALSLVAGSFAQQAPTVIRTETKLVLVDTVVTNKKGQYVDDLTLKDFKVWEDNKEQTLKTFSFGADPSAPDSKKYTVLFFDSMTLVPTELVQARIAAQRFVEANAGPDRVIAVAAFVGGLQIIQNFSPDIDKLKTALEKVRAMGTNRGGGASAADTVFGNTRNNGAMENGVRIDPTEDFAARAMLVALRGLAKNLADIPGRKSLILFTAGFPLSNNTRDEVNVTINTCNKSNVAIYPVDARGISGLSGMPSSRGRASLELPGPVRVRGVALAAAPVTRIAFFFMDQVGAGRGGGQPAGTPAGGGAPAGGGSPAGGGGVGGGTGNPGAGNPGAGRTGGMPGGINNGGVNNGGINNGGVNNGGNNNGRGGSDPFGNNNNNDPFNRNGNANGRGGPFGMPTMPNSTLDRQQVMYMLADGTGGFPILNTNDLVSGMEKIGKEQKSYYLVGYTPTDSPEGSCHVLKVKVDRGGTSVRARSGYCNSRSKDVLAGNPIEKTLESRVTGTAKGPIGAAMSVPFFYTGKDTARVAVTLEIPTEAIKFEKVKGKQHAAVNVLGIAYTGDATVAARFSDIVKLDFETTKEVDRFKQEPMHYENQFDIGVGTYAFKLVVDSGNENFGKLETPLTINAYDPAAFAISGIALSKRFGRVSDTDSNIDTLLLEGRAPLVAGNFKFTPTGYNRFVKTENVGMYFEVYDPALSGDAPPKQAIGMRVIDLKTNAQLADSGAVPIDSFVHTGQATVPAGLKLPIGSLQPGTYRLELKAQNSAGAWAVRTADFEIMP